MADAVLFGWMVLPVFILKRKSSILRGSSKQLNNTTHVENVFVGKRGIALTAFRGTDFVCYVWDHPNIVCLDCGPHTFRQLSIGSRLKKGIELGTPFLPSFLPSFPSLDGRSMPHCLLTLACCISILFGGKKSTNLTSAFNRKLSP